MERNLGPIRELLEVQVELLAEIVRLEIAMMRVNEIADKVFALEKVGGGRRSDGE